MCVCDTERERALSSYHMGMPESYIFTLALINCENASLMLMNILFLCLIYIYIKKKKIYIQCTAYLSVQ